MFVVLVNTLVLSLVDYSDPWATGPNPNKLRNVIVSRTNDVSLIIFSTEAFIKITALGFTGSFSYTVDNWNKLDFVVVASGILTRVLEALDTGSIVGLGQLRMLRILRPLRTLHSVPGLKVLVNSILSSLPALLNVTILLTFSYLVFAILGMDVWAGSYHGRCRLTEYPVVLDFNASNAPPDYTYPNSTYINLVLANPERYRCLNMSNDANEWSRQNCFWPLDPSDTVGLYCGSRKCNAGTFCGSNYDTWGLPRFNDIYVNGTLVYSITDEADFTPNLNFGLTSFDDIGSTMVIIIQVVTASGWMVLTENTQDSFSMAIGGVYFNLVLFIGMCFLLQLNMAVVYYEYQKAKELQEMQRLSSMPPALRAQQSWSYRRSSVERLFKTQEFKQEHAPGGSGLIFSMLRKHAVRVAASSYFKNAATIVTAINVLLLCSDHYPSDATFEVWSELVNFACLVYFIFEMAIKVAAGGWRSYLSDKFNQFDLLTILAGIVEFVLNPPRFVDGTPGNTSPIATFRLIRALKLARAWKSLNRLLVAIMDAMLEILNFLFFLVLFIYIYALLGMELFATKFQFDANNRPLPFNNTNPTSNLHRTNFDTIYNACFAVFQIITYDNWPAVMYDAWLSTGVIAPVYFISIVVLGVWVVMNMFCAIMVDSVTEGVDQSDHGDSDEERARRTRSKLKRIFRLVLAASRFRASVVYPDKNKGPLDHGRSLGLFRPSHPIRRACLYLVRHPRWNQAVICAIVLSCIFTALDTPLQDSTHGIGLAIDTANSVFAALFATEMAVTVVALGFVMGRNAYLQDPWRMLDCFIVVISILSWVIGDQKVGALSGLRSLRSLRALRPLRVINQLPQLKVVVNTLFRCLPDIGRMLFFLFFMLLLFAVPGVLFFKGAFSTCSVSPYNYLDNDMHSPPPMWFPPSYNGSYAIEDLRAVDIMTFPRPWEEIVPSIQQLLTSSCNMTADSLAGQRFTPTSKQVCECFGMTWNPVVPQRFDNILLALGSLFELTTFEGWTNVALASVDATGPDSQPIPNYQPLFMIFWVVFIIVGAFFVTNMFIAVLCDSFMREKYGALVTDEQIAWIKDQRKVLSLSLVVKYDPPKAQWRFACFQIVRDRRFEGAIIGCILLNMTAMTVTYSGQPQWMTAAINALNKICLAIFTMEAVLKLAAYGRSYFKEGWNRFDFVIVVLTAISELLPQNSSFSAGATAIRVFRVGRALRLINKARLMKSLFNTVLVSLPSVGNVMGLLLLMYYIYAALGVQLFARLDYGPSTLNSHQNFQTFWTAFQILIAFSTGENWPNFMWECYGSSCPGNSCATWLALPYFYSFTLFVGYIGLNIFSAIIVDAIGDDGKSPVTPETLEAFGAKWAEFDPRGSGMVTIQDLVVMLAQLPPPFGFKYVPGFTQRRIQKAVGDLNIPIYDKVYVHFKDVPRALVQRTLSEGNKKRFDEISDMMSRLGIDQEFEAIWKRTHRKKDVAALSMRLKTPVKDVPFSIYMDNFHVNPATAYGIQGGVPSDRTWFFHALAASIATSREDILMLVPILAPAAKLLAEYVDGSADVLERIHLHFVSDVSDVLARLDAKPLPKFLFVNLSSLVGTPDIFETAHTRALCLALKRLAIQNDMTVVLNMPEGQTPQWQTAYHIKLTVHGRRSQLDATTALTGATCTYSLLNWFNKQQQRTL
ncbi:unnamed protein product [Aphanomyces euteiches]